MIAFLRSRRCRLPLAVILLLVTQVAFAGQSCRAVMLGMGVNDHAATTTHQVSNASDSPDAAEADAMPCCDGHPPPLSVCLVPDDASTSAVLVAGGTLLPDLAPPADVAASTDAFRRTDVAPSHPAHSAAGPPLRIYIVYRRFLS